MYRSRAYWLIISFSLLLLLLSGCRKSVLSDISIEMPESLKVVVNIEEDRRKKRQLLVSIRDKTNHPVEFSNGAVIVNNTKLDFSLRTVLTTTRGYYYRIPGDEHEFTITVEWNETDAFTFVIDEAAGFPGFTNTIGINLRTNAKKFSIAPAPFADGKVSVAYDVLK